MRRRRFRQIQRQSQTLHQQLRDPRIQTTAFDASKKGTVWVMNEWTQTSVLIQSFTYSRDERRQAYFSAFSCDAQYVWGGNVGVGQGERFGNTQPCAIE